MLRVQSNTPHPRFSGPCCNKPNLCVHPFALADTCPDDEQKKEDARAVRRLELCLQGHAVLSKVAPVHSPVGGVPDTSPGFSIRHYARVRLLDKGWWEPGSFSWCR